MERTRFFDDLPFLSGRSKKGGEKGPVAVQNYNKCVELSSNTLPPSTGPLAHAAAAASVGARRRELVVRQR